MVEGFVLPDGCMRFSATIDPVSRSGFDCLHDLGKRHDEHTLRVHDWCEDEMDVVRHDNRSMQVVAHVVVVAAALKDNVASLGWQVGAMLSDESDEVGLVAALQMRQVTAVESHGFKVVARGGPGM